MAALAASAVTLLEEGFPDKGQRSVIRKGLKLTLTGQGGQTNTIGAAALGFTKVILCSNLLDLQNNKGYPAVVDPVNNVVILLDGAAAPAPVDVTSNAAYITVTGSPRIPTAL